MNRCDMPPRIAAVQEMTCLLVVQHEQSTIVGQLWIHNFIKCHDTLKLKYNHKYDYQRAKCKDSKFIQVWFQHIQATIAEYSIHKDDIYNFDETGFQMSVISTAKMITESNQADRSRTTQLDNCE